MGICSWERIGLDWSYVIKLELIDLCMQFSGEFLSGGSMCMIERNSNVDVINLGSGIALL